MRLLLSKHFTRQVVPISVCAHECISQRWHFWGDVHGWFNKWHKVATGLLLGVRFLWSHTLKFYTHFLTNLSVEVDDTTCRLYCPTPTIAFRWCSLHCTARAGLKPIQPMRLHWAPHLWWPRASGDPAPCVWIVVHFCQILLALKFSRNGL